MKPPISEFRSYLIKEVGENWVKGVSDEELTFFRDWCAKTSVYPIKNDEDHKHLNERTGHAFRGFVQGLVYERY